MNDGAMTLRRDGPPALARRRVVAMRSRRRRRLSSALDRAARRRAGRNVPQPGRSPSPSLSRWQPSRMRRPPPAICGSGTAGREGDRLVSATAEIADRVADPGGDNFRLVMTKVHAGRARGWSSGRRHLQLRPGSYRLSSAASPAAERKARTSPARSPSRRREPSRSPIGRAEYVAPIGGPFALIDQNGKPFTDADLRASPTRSSSATRIVPTSARRRSSRCRQALAKLGADADRLRVVFVTVDPARDTPELPQGLSHRLRPAHRRPDRQARRSTRRRRPSTPSIRRSRARTATTAWTIRPP